MMINSSNLLTLLDDRSQVLRYDNPLFHCFIRKLHFSGDSKYQITEHWHEDMEYLYVKEGAFRCSVNGTRITLSEGDGICINSRRIHSNGTVAGQSCLLYCAIIHPSCLCASRYIEDKYVSSILGPGTFDYLSLTEKDWTADILRTLLSLFENPPSAVSELGIIEASYHILGSLYRKFQPGEAHMANTSPYEDIFKSMASYIRDHFQEKLSLDDIAATGNIGKTLCSKIFKKYASKTPGDYLIHYRITRSMEWLADKKQNITDIAYLCGFNSASHYTQTFRRIIGCTPNQFRAQLISNA